MKTRTNSDWEWLSSLKLSEFLVYRPGEQAWPPHRMADVQMDRLRTAGKRRGLKLRISVRPGNVLHVTVLAIGSPPMTRAGGLSPIALALVQKATRVSAGHFDDNVSFVLKTPARPLSGR